MGLGVEVGELHFVEWLIFSNHGSAKTRSSAECGVSNIRSTSLARQTLQDGRVSRTRQLRSKIN